MSDASPEESEETLVLCLSLADHTPGRPLMPGTLLARCGCGTELLASPAAFTQGEQGAKLVCFPCLTTQDPGALVHLVPGAIEEMREIDPRMAAWAESIEGMPLIETPLHPSWRG